MDPNFIDTLKESIPKNYDNVDYLSKAVVDLARWTYYHNTLVAQAELEERKEFVEVKEYETKISNDEAAARAVQNTGNKYGLLKLEMQSNEHLINALKLRIRVLMGEKDNARLE